jgi:lipoprotein-anchoring transpeptidase ErfK/SrfK
MVKRCSKRSIRNYHGFFAIFCAGLLSLGGGCAWLQEARLSPEERAAREAAATRQEQHAAFRAASGWQRKTFEDADILRTTTPENSRIIVSLADQRGLLLQGNEIALDFPIASGKRSHPTPSGSYNILSMKRDHRSNLYGKVVDAEGQVVQSSADVRRAEIPPGGEFVGSPMPLWLRLTNDGVGLHVGHLPGRPASHGCVRLPRRPATLIFERVRVGTAVDIVDSFDPASLQSR